MRLLECGKILTTHGIRGEVKIKIETDDLSRFDKGMELFIGTENKKDETKIIVDGFRVHKEMGLLLFNGIKNINDVLMYVGKSIYVDVEKYNPGEYFLDDYIGLDVYDKGEKIGVVVDIMEVPQGEILVIKKNNGKEALVPFVDEFVVEIDVENNKMIIESIEGLL